MDQLKHKKVICPNCKGNGYVKLPQQMPNKEQVAQCMVCNSNGEMMKIKLILSMLMLMAFTGCSEFALLMSGSSIAISQNVYAKAYNGADMLTIMSSEKSIKKQTLMQEK